MVVTSLSPPDGNGSIGEIGIRRKNSAANRTAGRSDGPFAAPATRRFIVSPWMIWMNWRATWLQKRTMPKSRSSRKHRNRINQFDVGRSEWVLNTVSNIVAGCGCTRRPATLSGICTKIASYLSRRYTEEHYDPHSTADIVTPDVAYGR